MKHNHIACRPAMFMPVLMSVSLLVFSLLAEVSKFRHNFIYPIVAYDKITVDVYGALFPTALSALCVILYFARFKGSFLKILLCFLFAFLLSAFSTKFEISGSGIELQNSPGSLGLLVGLETVFIIFFDEQAMKAKTLASLIRFRMARDFIVALLATFSVSSLSALGVDLSYMPFLNQNASLTSINIGGGGITDGIFLFGSFSVIWTTFFISLLAMCVEIVHVFHKNEDVSGKRKRANEQPRKRRPRKETTKRRTAHAEGNFTLAQPCQPLQ